MENKSYLEVKDLSIHFAARFGFISNEIFCKYLCGLGRTQNFIYFKRLLAEKLIYKCRGPYDVYYLTARSKNVACKTVASRSIFFIEHDLSVVKILFSLIETGLVLRFWTEPELLGNHSMLYSVLGTDKVEKSPDLVVDLKSASGFLRFAIEVERSAKTKQRYDHLALSYLQLKNVHLSLFVCENDTIKKSIANSFQEEIFAENNKIPILLLASDFEKEGLQASVSFSSRVLPLRKLIEAASQIKFENSQFEGKIHRTSVRSIFKSHSVVA